MKKEDFEKELKEFVKQELNPISILTSFLPPVIHEIFTQGISNLEKKRMARFIRLLIENSEEIEKKMDKKFIKTEDFECFFEKTFDAVKRSRTDLKIKMIQKAFLNGVNGKNYEKSILILDKIDEIDDSHAIILGHIYRHHLDGVKYGRGTSVLLNGVDDHFKNIDKFVIEQRCDELVSLGILQDSRGTIHDGNTKYDLKDFGVAFCKELSIDKIKEKDK